MEQWINTQILILAMLELNKNGGVPPDYWEMKDGGNYKTTGEFDVESAKEHLVSVKQARVYELDGRVQRMFILTPNRPRRIEIPFPKIFLNPSIEYNDIMVVGLLLERDDRYDDGDILIRFLTKRYPNKPKGVSIADYMRRASPDELHYCNSWAIWLNKVRPEIENPLKKECSGDLAKLIRRAVMNFNDFLEHPDVIVKERVRKNNEKRVKRGKPAYPNSTVIGVRGELRIYINSIAPQTDSDDNVGGCFEVAGHWRTYRHSKYTNMQGERQFIHPYLKGTGIPEIKRRKIGNSEKPKDNLLRARGKGKKGKK